MRDFEEINEDQLTHEQIEKRAYEIYLRHNGEDGRAVEDWLIAEEELRRKPTKRESVAQREKL